jgi:hypothetical protein
MSKRRLCSLPAGALAFLFVIWSLAEAASIPEFLRGYEHYENLPCRSPAYITHWQHHYRLRTVS